MVFGYNEPSFAQGSVPEQSDTSEERVGGSYSAGSHELTVATVSHSA